MNTPPRTLHRCRINLAVLALLGAHAHVMAAGPLPSGGQVVSGNVRIVPGSAASLDVVQSSSRAVVNWDGFSVGAGNQVRFVQPNAGSATLNRVVGTTPSTIAGTLQANGQLFLVNPNGIAITRSGTVDVGGGFVASTLAIADEDFQAGLLRFSGTGASARISQDGTIRTEPGGAVVLLGGSVSNKGLIAAPLGKIMVGSGEMATLDLHGDGMLQVAVPTASAAPDGAPQIDIGGTVRADGGRIWVSAATAGQAWRDVVNVSGELIARTVSGRDGAIVLEAGPGGIVNVSGQLTASGDRGAGDIHIGGAAVHVDGTQAAVIARSENGQGGSITLAPQGELTLGRSLLDASGATGGGSIRLGGDAYGAGNLVHAQRSVIGPDTRLRADATRDGTGGRVIVWSDERTEFFGDISARGAGAQGAGGFAEVSSQGVLRFAGQADLRGAPGRAGNLLLDPFDITISAAADSNHDASFTANGNDSVVNVTTLQNALATANVTVSTGGGGAQAGDITVASAVAWNSGTTLTLSAARDINVNADVTSNGGSLTLNAGRGVGITGATIDTAGGNLIATTNSTDGTSGVRLNGATIDVGTGTGTLTGTSDLGFGVRFLVAPSELRASGAGSITLTGTSTSSHGVVVETDLATSGQVTIAGLSSTAFGIDFHGTAISSSGDLAFSGSSDTSNAVWVAGNTLSLSNTGTGVLSVEGTSNDFNGIRLNTGASLTTLGTVQLAGTSLGNGGGFSLVGSNTITVNGGNTTVTGTATSPFNAIDMASSGNSVANNGAGTLALIGNGNITLAAPVTSPSGSLAIDASGDLTLASGAQLGWAAGTTQSLNAGRDIHVNAPISGSGGLQLIAGRSVAVNSDITASGGPLNVGLTGSDTGGSISIANATIATGGGNLTASAAQTGTITGILLSDATLNVGNGTGTLNGGADNGSGIFVIGALQALAGGSGSLTFNGNSSSGNGVTFDNNGSLATTGRVTLAGVSDAAVGFYLLGANTLSNAGGDLALAGTSSTNTGLWFNAGTNTLTNAGAGTMSLTGSSGSFRGIGLNSNVDIAAVGNVSLSGTATGDAGVWFNGSNRLTESNGNLAISGITSQGDGVHFDSGANSLNQAGTGSITIDGLSASSAGLVANIGAALTTSGTVQLSGTSLSDGDGFSLAGSNTITVNGGNTTITGTATSPFDAIDMASSGNSVANNGAGTLALIGNGNITLAASVTSPSGSLAIDASGDLTLASGAQLGWAAGTTQTLNAGRDIHVNAALSGSGGLQLIAGRSVAVNRDITASGGPLNVGLTASDTGGSISIANATIATGGGNLTASATQTGGIHGILLSDATLNVGNGSGTLNGGADNGSGIFVIGALQALAGGSGSLTFNGNSSSGSGVTLDNNASLATTGRVTLAGVSGSGAGMLFAGNNLVSAGSGAATLNATSGSGNGMQIEGTNAFVNAAGALAINASSSAGNGVDITDGAAVSTSGDIAFAGTSGSAAGMKLGQASFTHSQGDLTLAANADTATSMLLAPGSSIANQGSGTLHLDAATGIALGGSISSPNGALWLSAAGQVTQSAGSIAASRLRLSGAGAAYTLEASGNEVQTLSADTGSVALRSASSLTIGSVLGAAGARTTGTVTIRTDGDLTIAAGAAVNGASPVLAAGGDFINRSGTAAVAATSGRWLIYAADPATSRFGGLNSGNTALWSATHASRSPDSITDPGHRYLFALQPTLTVASTGASKVYGDDASSSIAGNYTVTGLQNGVANAFLGDTAASAYGGSPSVSSDGAASTANVNESPYAVVVSQGSLSSSAGYGFAFASTGRLTVTPRALAFVAQAATRPYGQANPSLQGTLVGFANGDTLGDIASGTPVWTSAADPTSLPGTYAILGGGLDVTSLNYVLTQDPGNAFALSVTPRAAATVAPPDGAKSTSAAFAGNSGAYCVLGPLLTRSEQTRCKLESDAVRMPVLQEQEAELP